MKSLLTVNDHAVSDETIKTEFNRLQRVYAKRLTADELRKKTPSIQKQAVEQVINRFLLLEEAFRRGITVPAEKISAILAKATTKEAGHPDAIRENIRNACLVEILTGRIVSVVTEPTEDEALEYLRQSDLPIPDDSLNPDLKEKVLNKSRHMLHLLRKNQALTEFIASLRKTAAIKYSSSQTQRPPTPAF